MGITVSAAGEAGNKKIKISENLSCSLHGHVIRMEMNIQNDTSLRCN